MFIPPVLPELYLLVLRSQSMVNQEIYLLCNLQGVLKKQSNHYICDPPVLCYWHLEVRP